ncbi:MAG: hypothetical protein GY859_20090, partial [Desulfobacterales bacterium]|nr:hypothetical protein [Desulfobacterales bacterium]
LFILIKERGISPRINLIAGLPGDDPGRFRASVDYVAEFDLGDDVQVFSLFVLPGSDFRKRNVALDLNYEPSPPYTIIDTPTFSSQEMRTALDYADVRFDMAIYPLSDLDASWRPRRGAGEDEFEDHAAAIGGERFITKRKLFSPRLIQELAAVASRLTTPYQIIVGPDMRDHVHLREVLEITTAANPFTPLEIIFLQPHAAPDVRRLLSAARLRRPIFYTGIRDFSSRAAKTVPSCSPSPPRIPGPVSPRRWRVRFTGGNALGSPTWWSWKGCPNWTASSSTWMKKESFQSTTSPP